MRRRPPRSKRTDTLFPYTTCFRSVADLVKIPACLVRQTDLIVATARATMRHEGLLHVKKAQFLAPADCRNILMKVAEAAKPDMTILCERGSEIGRAHV